jgi:DNA-binding transcriptional ArsR family regulator
VNVEVAARVFQSTLRMHLIRYYLDNPGPQRDAGEILGVSQRTIGANIRALVEAGVLIEEPAEDRRLQTYSVDVERVDELLDAARDFAIGKPRR